jgi:Concanavalin A-like lectin/glucanases superfamily
MIDWAFVLTPLLVLPIALMFRFVGCSSFSAAPDAPPPDDKPPRYRDFIMAVPGNPGTVKNPGVKPNAADVIGYWRLVDAAASTVAKDEKGFQDGAYVATPGGLTAVPPTSTDAGSEGSPGTIVTGQPGLITTDPGAMCRFYNGGHVEIPYKSGLYTDDFTLEAWVEVQWGPMTTGFDHILFSAGGHYSRPFTGEPPTFVGFTLRADRDNRWQVFASPHLGQVFSAPPMVPVNGPTYIALTVKLDGGQRLVTLYVDGKQFGPEGIGFYSRPDGAPLVIAVGNSDSSPSDPVAPTNPMIARVQEVVLYRRALSLEEVENHFALNPKKV